MQCPHCADSIRYGTSRGVQRYRCQACRRIFQTMGPGKILYENEDFYSARLFTKHKEKEPRYLNHSDSKPPEWKADLC